MIEKVADDNRRKQTKAAEQWHFRDLIVWQKAMELTREVYKATATFPHAEMFGLTAQMRRAAVSVPSNIAEGCGRVSGKGMRVFLGHARGSVYELETQLRLAESLSFVQPAAAQPLVEGCWEIVRMLNALIKRLEHDDA